MAEGGYKLTSNLTENNIAINKSELLEFASEIRKSIVKTAYNTKQAVHIGGAMSMADVLAVLYGKIMQLETNNPNEDTRDRFVLSKGHDCLGLYAALHIVGIITDEELRENFLTDGGFLPVHTVKRIDKGIECTSGSLGMGLSFGIGKALAAKSDNKTYKTFVLVGDGECNEGEIWEAIAAAKHYKLDNLIMIVDRNRLQSDGATNEIMNIDLVAALKSFGWNVSEIDGHNIEMITEALSQSINNANNVPSAIVANTTKGKGVSFMENNNAWHHGLLTEKLFHEAMEELLGDRDY